MKLSYDESLLNFAFSFNLCRYNMVKAYAEQIIGTPYQFPSYHIGIREPFDYYQMANAYIGSLLVRLVHWYTIRVVSVI